MITYSTGSEYHLKSSVEQNGHPFKMNISSVVMKPSLECMIEWDKFEVNCKQKDLAAYTNLQVQLQVHKASKAVIHALKCEQKLYYIQYQRYAGNSWA